MIFSAALLFIILIFPSMASFNCMDMNNNPVDWFIFYKLPKDPFSNPNGFGYLYIDDNIQKHWEEFPEADLGSQEQSVAYTLEQFYDAKNDTQVFSLFYNDQPPNFSKPSGSSQSKGVIVFDNSTGFWFTHSISQFPDASFYNFPINEEIDFAHMGICISFPFESLAFIGNQLATIQPNLFSKQIPNSFLEHFPIFSQFSTEQAKNPASNVELIPTLGGLKVLSFAKSAELEKDLYSDIIAPSLQSNLTVQSIIDKTTLSSNRDANCGQEYKIFESLEVQIPENSITIPNAKDHSKFVVTSNPDNIEELPYVCVGDIDRQRKEESVGGSALCLYLSGLWHVFNRMISSTNSC